MHDRAQAETFSKKPQMTYDNFNKLIDIALLI